MTAPHLSICIATLNRAAFLDTMLDSIISQATDEIEIVIVDGASTDGTSQVVPGYREKFPRINYLRLPAKGGVDQDYNRAVELAQGVYCWLMSDDDKLKPGAIQAVLDATRQGYDLIIVNGETRTFDLTETLVPRHLALATNQFYSPGDQEQFFVQAANYLTYIGCVVIKHSLWMERERDKYFGTGFVHVGVIFQASLLNGVFVLAEPWIILRHGNASWIKGHFEIWNFKWPHVIWSFDFSDDVKQQIVLREPWRNKKGLLASRAKGAYSLQDYERLLAPRLTVCTDRWLSRIIALTPGWIANVIVLTYFSIFYSRERQALADFKTSRFYLLNWVRRFKPSAQSAR